MNRRTDRARIDRRRSIGDDTRVDQRRTGTSTKAEHRDRRIPGTLNIVDLDRSRRNIECPAVLVESTHPEPATRDDDLSPSELVSDLFKQVSSTLEIVSVPYAWPYEPESKR